MNNNTIDILQKTRNIVAEHWYKGGLTDNCGNVCIMGAINMVVYGTVHPAFSYQEEDGRDEPCAALMARLPEGEWGSSIAGFNDAPSVTQADVLKLLDDAIADLMGESLIEELDELAEAMDEGLVAV